MAQTGTPLRTLLVSDGKPGHFNLAEGIVAAIARRRPVEVTRVPIVRPWWLPARGLSALTYAGRAGQRLVPQALGFPERPIPDCDLVVSAGGDTLAANVLLARTYGCPNIFYGSLRRYRPDAFALVLTSYAANASRPNHAMTLKPSAFDPDGLPERTTGGMATGLLIGGDSGTVGYAGVDWKRLLGLLAEAPGGAGAGAWIVANSRRTPDATSDTIATLAAAAPSRIRFIDVRAAGPGTLAALFEGSDRIAVTVDSSSMVSEAVWARKPTVVLAPDKAGLPSQEQAYRDYLDSNGWTSTLALREATAASLDACFATIRPRTGNPLDELATLIAGRLPALDLQLSASSTAIRSPA